MKKLMIAVAIVCAAVVSEAASLNWGAGVYNGSEGPDCTEGQVAYLVYSATAMSKLASVLTIDGGTMTVNNGGTIVDTYELTSNDAHTQWSFMDEWVRSDAEGGVNGYYQILLLNEDGDHFAVLDAGQVTGISDTSSAGNATVPMNWSDTSTYLGGTGYPGDVVTVPEPTSGLLLLLGLAGMALKRKRA